MAYGDEKVIVKLKDGEKYGALIETDGDGKERTYYPKQFAVHWDCEKLQIRQGFAYRDENDQEPPKMITYVTGVARLAADYDVSVIGEPGNKTTTVEISFRPDDSPDLLKERDDEKDDTRLRLSHPYGRAHLGFNRADWELQAGDQWWLECRLHSSALQPLVEAIAAGTLKKAGLSVRLGDLFTDEPPYVPFTSDAHLFLRPNKRDNTINSPEMAHGWLEAIGLSLQAVDISLPSESEPDFEQDKEPTDSHDSPPSPPSDISKVTERIEATRLTIKWVGGFIILALFMLLLK